MAGSLNNFEPFHGYWVEVSESKTFTFVVEDAGGPPPPPPPPG